MGYMICVVIGGILCGALLGAYLQLYYAVFNVSLAWETLVKHAIAKRQALISLAQLLKKKHSLLEQEVAFLSEHQNMSWRVFLRNGYTILFAFREMEESLPQAMSELFEFLESCEDQDEALLLIEDFWASDNLFAFETAAYEQAVDKYLKQRQQASLWFAQSLFRFLDIPEIRFGR
ncbi:hypothetical protein [Chlamydia sp. 17-3921]|uniref:hypothetical protein n=1 Tax=Chlamydia sp. 17-3921 TaxID=2675798 RepID=UPI001919D12A|nr:hypothetical protein [Chlamydia sp. 17-3921]